MKTRYTLSILFFVSGSLLFSAEPLSRWEQAKRAVATARDVTYGALLRGTGIRYVTPKQIDDALNDPDDFNRFIRKYGKNASVAASQMQRFKIGGIPLLTYVILSDHENSEALAIRLVELGARLTDKNLQNDPLMNAIQANKSSIVQLLLQHNVPISEKSLELAFEKGNPDLINQLIETLRSTGALHSSYVPLHAAIKAGNKQMVKYLLDAGVNSAIADQSGNTPLHVAAEKGNLDIVKMLIERGADVNARNASSATPLHYADTGVTQLLLSKRAHIDAMDNAGNTPLFNAVHRNQLNKMNILIQAGAHVHHKNARGNTLLQESIAHPSLALTLLDSVPVDINHQNTAGDSALHLAVLQSSPSLVEALLARGALANMQNGQGITPLLYAIKNGQIPIVEVLLKHGANIHLADHQHNSALHYAFMGSSPHRELIELLVRHGARAEVSNESGKTPIHYAIKRHSWHIIAPLINNVHNINLTDRYGNTLLHEALMAYYPDLHTIHALRQRGAFIDVKNGNYETPLHLAALLKSPDIVRELLETHKPFDIDVRDRQGFTPFHRAIANNDLATAQLLRSRGAKVNVRNSAGDTPLHTAGRRQSLVKYLLAQGADPSAKNSWGQLSQYTQDKIAREEQERRRLQEENRQQAEAQRRAQQEQQRRMQEEQQRLREEQRAREESQRLYPELTPFELSVPAQPPTYTPPRPSAPPMEPEDIDPYAGASAPPFDDE